MTHRRAILQQQISSGMRKFRAEKRSDLPLAQPLEKRLRLPLQSGSGVLHVPTLWLS